MSGVACQPGVWRAMWSWVAESGKTGIVATPYDAWVVDRWRPIYADTDLHTLWYEYRGAMVDIACEERATVATSARPKPRRRGLLKGKRW